MVGTHNARWWSRRVVMGMGMVVVGREHLCLYLVTSSSRDWLRPVILVFCQSLNFQNHERPKTRLWLWSLLVLRISSLGQSWSSPVSVFFQSWDWTSKHYWPLHPPAVGFWPPKPCTNPHPYLWNTLTHGKRMGLCGVRVKVDVKTPMGYPCPSLASSPHCSGDCDSKHTILGGSSL